MIHQKKGILFVEKQMYYYGTTLRLKSPTNGLFVRQFAQTNIK